MRSRRVEGNIIATKISIKPSRKPARHAPIIDPLPPKMAATKAFQPNRTPIYGSSTGYARPKRIPATAAKAEPKANVILAMRFNGTPISGTTM